MVLIAAHYDLQVAFYRDQLGLHVRSSHHGATFFDCGDQVLAVFARGHHPQGDKSLGMASHGISHLEFIISAGDAEVLSSRLIGAGMHAYEDVFHDADGNLFHFVIR